MFDSELKVMDILWKEGDLTAGQIAKILKEQTGWNRNTTYTVIKKLIEKGAVERYGENYFCRAIITKKQVQQFEAHELVDILFDGKAELLLSAFLGGKHLSADEVVRLKKLVDELK